MNLPRVYGIVDGEITAKRGLSLSDAAEALLDGGMLMLQLRWKGSYTREVYAEAVRMADACRAAGGMFIINDRSDIALLLDAGVHVGQDDLPPQEVRGLLGLDRAVGVSTHNEGQFAAAMRAPVDYIAVGPIYSTGSKQKPDRVVGVADLARLRRMYEGPLVAIGGITRERAPAVWSAGADSLAVIADLYPDPCTKASVRERAAEWVRVSKHDDTR